MLGLAWGIGWGAQRHRELPGLSAGRFLFPVRLINLIAITLFIGMTAFQCLDLPM